MWYMQSEEHIKQELSIGSKNCTSIDVNSINPKMVVDEKGPLINSLIMRAGTK